MTTLRNISRRIMASIAYLRNSTMRSGIGRYGLLAIISAMIYACVFSYFTILRHNTFYSAGWDLGIFNQAFHTTLYEGRFFYSTPDLFFSPSGSLFAIHISPILLLLVPFYAVGSSPATLLVIKSFAVGFGAVPLYLLAKQFLKDDKQALMLAMVYLTYVPLQGANWFDFQQSALLPFFLFLMFYFMIKKNWKLYFPTMLLSLMIEEHIAIAVAILAIYYFSFTYGLRSLPKSLKQLKAAESLVPISTVVVCVAYLFSAMFIKSTFPVSVNFSEVYKASGNFAILGSSDVLSFPIYILLHPQRAVAALIFDYPSKFFYMIMLLAPLLFIPLRNRFVFGILILMAPFLLSNYNAYYLVGIHYPFYILPVIFIATIYGLSRIELNARWFDLKIMIVVTLIFAISTSPLSPISSAFVNTGSLFYSPIQFSIDENKMSLNDLISAIPANASVLTQNLIFAHVSGRANAYAIPFNNYGKPEQMQEYISYLLNNSEYVLLDLGSYDEMTRTVLNDIIANNSYGPYALASQAVLFRRGYTEEPLYAHYTEERIFEVSHDLNVLSPPGSLFEDSSANGEKVFFYPRDSVGTCVYGPYVYLLPGSYEVTFTVKVGEHSDGYLGTFDVATDMGTNIVSVKDTYGFELKPDEWINITLPFSLVTLKTEVEFRVASGGTADMYFDRVVVKRISASPVGTISSKTVRTRDLRLGSGNLTQDGFLIHPQGAAGEVFWYGPFWSLSPGTYSATFMLRAWPSPQNPNRLTLTLSIIGRNGESRPTEVLTERNLYTQDFRDQNTSNWKSFTVDFTVKNFMIDVEFNGLWPSPDYSISLAFITIERLS